MLLRATSSELPVIILKTPSPCIPLPLQKGKGKELVKRGSTPLHFPFCISLFYMSEGSTRGAFAPLVLPSLLLQRRKESVNKRGGFAPSLKFFPPLLLKERGIKG
jgi:hypothetical protein